MPGCWKKFRGICIWNGRGAAGSGPGLKPAPCTNRGFRRRFRHCVPLARLSLLLLPISIGTLSAQRPPKSGSGERGSSDEKAGGQRSCLSRIRISPFGKSVKRAFGSFLQAHLKYLRQMQGPPVCLLQYLLAATESIRYDQNVAVGAPDPRQKNPLSALDSDFIVGGLITECPGHAAATGIEDFIIEADFSQDAFFVLEFESALVMAMPMHHRLALKPGRLIILYLLFQKLTQQVCLLA